MILRIIDYRRLARAAVLSSVLLSGIVPDEDWPVTRSGLDTAFFGINTLWPLARPFPLSIPPDFIMLDDPMRRLTVPGQDSLGQVFTGMADDAAAAREVCAYMKTMRRQFPVAQTP
ncbi:MAG: hypothetical protein EHM17_12610 [Verrucomicrobiaceae bacterium]|nr:MAG: hypothetical protein EHM17_12610 [Verrucomicrobiaceae bacterium]